MTKIYYTLFILSYLSLLSCGSSSNTAIYTNPHAEPHIQIHQDLIDEENKKVIDNISGSYSGLLPCSDCEHINYYITLNSDLTYKLVYTYIGKSKIPVKKSGKFIITSRLTIQLDNLANGMNMMKKTPIGLQLLDKNGNEFSKELIKQYKLDPVQVGSDNFKSIKHQFLLKKWNKGIDFYAFGNEPSWSLDMNFNKSMHLKNLDGLNFYAPVEKPEQAMDANITRYRTVTDNGEIIAQLTETKCTDNMSGEVFDYIVNVDYKANENSDYETYKGCGNFIVDPRLHDVWAIIEVDNMKLDPKTFNNKLPRIELNTMNKSVIGNDACNNFNGNFSIEGNGITFSPLASAMMACMDNFEISTKIGKVLSDNKLTYQIEGNQLVLKENDKIRMRLNRID